MAARDEEFKVAIDVDAETSKVASKLAALDKTMQSTSKTIAGMSSYAREYGAKHEAALAQAEAAQNNLTKTILQNQSRIQTAHENVLKAMTDADKAAADAQLALAQKQQTEQIAAAEKAAAKAQASVKETADAFNKAYSMMGKDVTDLEKKIQQSGATLGAHMEFGKLATEFSKELEDSDLTKFRKMITSEVTGGFDEAWSSLKGKDLSGIIKGGGKLASGILKGVGGAGAAGLVKGGAAAQKKGAAMGGGMGKGLEMIGSVMGKIAPLVGTLAKLGPVLGLVSSSFAAIVKLMIDVESAAKAINKDLMQGGALGDSFAESMAGLPDGFNKGAVAASNLNDQLTDIREQISGSMTEQGRAVIEMHLGMGTVAKDHYAVLDAMKKEGVTLKKLKDSQKESAGEAAAAAASGQTHLAGLSQSMTKYSGLTSVAIGYSRIFGVSIEEMGQMQGELMTQLATSATGVALEFSKMTQAAVESGIEVNKFFNIIRSVSSDLSLYGMRLKDVTKTLKIMGKTMDQNTAKKFMQTLTQGFKGKSIADRIKTAYIGGAGIKKAAQGDVDEKMTDLIKQVMEKKGVGEKEARAALESGDVEGAERQAYMRLKRRDKALKSGGVVGTAVAMEDMGPVANAEAIKAAIERFGGKLGEGSPMQMLAAEQATGFSQEDQMNAAAFFDGIDMQKKLLKQLFAKQAKGEELTQDQLRQIKQANEAGLTDAAKVDAAGSTQIYKSMDESREDAAKKAEEQLKAAYESGKLSQDMLAKMDILIDALFNWLYKVLVGVWEAVEDIVAKFGIGSTDERDVRKLQVMAAKTKNKELIDLTANATSADDVRHKMFYTSGAKDMGETFYSGAKEREDATKKQKEVEKKWVEQGEKLKTASSTMSREDEAKLAEEYKKTTAEKAKADADAAKAIAKYRAAVGALEANLGGADSWVHSSKETKKDRLQQGMSMAFDGKIDYAKLSKAFASIERGDGLETTLSQAGFSMDEQAKILDKLRLTLSPEQMLKATAAYQKEVGGPAAPGATPGQAAPPGTPAPGTPAPGTPAPGPAAAAPPQAAAPPPKAPAAAAPPPAAPVAPAAQAEAAKAQLQALAAPDPAKAIEEQKAAIEDGSAYTVKSLQDLWNAMRVKGIKIDKSMTIEQHFKKAIEEGSLAAIRKGLFEYAMYSSNDPAKLIERMQKSGFAEVGQMATAFKDDVKNADFLKPNAEGGVVTSVSGGIAQVQKIPMGEGLASIGKGERILPAGAGAGGGGGNVQVNVNGIGGQDLANYLKVKVAEAIYEYKRREKFT